MSKPISEKTKIVHEYCVKYPKLGHGQLARLIMKEVPELFGSQNAANLCVRKVRGKQGTKMKRFNYPKDVVENFKRSNNGNPYSLPESHQELRKPFVIPKANKNILVISDLHIPYHDITSITLALDYGKKNKIDTIVINGDLIDFHYLSRFQKDPRKRSVAEELEAAREFLSVLRKNFKGIPIYYLLGNHDMRYQHWLESKAIDVLGCPEFELTSLLRLGELGITLIDDKTIIKAGKLTITHGHLIIRGVFAPVNSARGAYMRAKQSIIIGHTHKISEHTETNIDGEITTTWSTGCLCELSPDYNPYANGYAHGFAHVQITDTKGNYSVKNFRIYNGKIL